MQNARRLRYQRTMKENNEEYLDYFLGNSPEEAETTYVEFADMLNQFARSYSLSSGIPRADLFGEAVMALAAAKRDYDPEVGNRSFKTFAIYRIKWALNAYVAENLCVVRVPAYIQTANSYINSIKYLLSKYDLPYEDIRDVLLEDSSLKEGSYDEIRRYKDALINLAKRHKLDYKALIDRSEFLPGDVYLNEDMGPDELIERENHMLRAALIVNQLKEHMDDEELIIAEGVMAGKTWHEIGTELGISHEGARKKMKSLRERLRERFLDE